MRPGFSPSSCKSTLATSVHHGLKIRKKNSVFVGEAATDYIAEWGIPILRQIRLLSSINSLAGRECI